MKCTRLQVDFLFESDADMIRDVIVAILPDYENSIYVIPLEDDDE